MGVEVLYRAENISYFNLPDKLKLSLVNVILSFIPAFMLLLSIIANYWSFYSVFILHEKVIWGIIYIPLGILITYILIVFILSPYIPEYKRIEVYKDKIVLENNLYPFFDMKRKKIEIYYTDRIKKLYTNENNEYVAMYFLYNDLSSDDLKIVAIYKDQIPRLSEFLRSLKKVVKDVDAETKISRRELIELIKNSMNGLGKEPCDSLGVIGGVEGGRLREK